MQINPKAKVEKVASKDQSRPVLTNLYLRIDGDSGTLEATDSYKLVTVPVKLDEGDTEGFVPPAALVEARKQNGRSDTALACNGACVTPNGASFPRPDAGKFPNTAALYPPEVELFDFEIGLNAKHLYELAQAMGSDKVAIKFYRQKDYDKESGEPVYKDEPSALRPISVRPILGGAEGAKGLVMPIRISS